MNLFENIFDKFTKQAQPMPSFGTPQAPKTSSYVAPNIPTTAQKVSQGVRNGGFAPGYEGTVDETKGSFFQGLQGVQNVFNELPKALEATAQSGKKQFEQEISKKRQTFISDMLAQGYKKEDIFKAMDNLQAQGEFDFNPGIAGNIVGGIGERLGSIGETTSKLSQIDNPLERTVAGVIPYAGQTVATALQPITSAIEPYVSPVVQKIVQETNQTERLQDWSNQWSKFEKTNPILAENIAGLLNVSQLAPVPFAKPIANATGNVVKQTGKSIVRGAEKVAPVAKTIIKKPVSIVKNKAIDIFGKELRPVQDIAGNILQPYKGMVENLDDATAGLRRVVDETGTKTDTFEGLLGKIEETQKKYGQMKQESLGGIVQTRKSASAQKALENLENVYSDVSSKDMLTTQARVKALAKKNMEEGLTPLEMDEVKVLHTKSNNLFNEKGQATGGFSSDDLRGIRKDLKEEIEQFAEENGVSNIRDINKVYGEISDAKTLAQNQVDNLRSYKGRQIPATRVQKIVDFLVDFPVIKQLASDPARTVISSFFKNLRGDKINPIEVQKRLPEFLKELKDAGMKAGDMQKVEKMIQNEIKLLPPASKEALLAEKIAQPDITKKSIIRQPTTPTKQEIQLTKQAQRQAQVKEVEKELNTILLSKYNPNKPEATKKFIESNIAQGKLTKEEAITLVENQYEKANGFDKPHYEKMLNDLYSNKKTVSFDDLLNEKTVQTNAKTAREMYLETPKGMYETFRSQVGDRRYNLSTNDALIADFKKKTGFDLMKDGDPKFDADGNIIKAKKPIVKPNTIKNESKVIKPTSSDTIPEGYFKNAFGEIVKNPSNKKGGFIRNPFAKIEPKRLFAGENSAQPPKGKTGWFKGADGKMRFEIDDSQATFNTNTSADKNGYIKLDKILSHNELFRQYPELKNIDVRIFKNDTESSFLNDQLPLGPGEKRGIIHLGIKEKTPEQQKSTLLHEIQHAIQNKEGFARGGNPESFKQGIEYYKKLADYNRDILGDIRYDKMLEKDKTSIAYKKLVKEEEEALRTYKIANEKYKELSSTSPMESYNNQAGEVEARNVQSRMNLTAKERTIKKPESTEDVPRAKQIIRMDSKGPSMLIKKPKQSATMGDMETKKLIEEARKYKSSEDYLKKDTITYLEFQKELGKEKDILESWHNKKVYKNINIKISDIAPTWQQKTAILDIKQGDKSFTKRPVTLVYRNGQIEIKDGRHRTAEAIMKGDKIINANIIDMSGDLPKNFNKYNTQ